MGIPSVVGSEGAGFGHSVKTFWIILKIGELLVEPSNVNFALPKIHRIMEEAFIEDNGTGPDFLGKMTYT